MPLQNRVTPFGEIVAVPERGMFTGNRGIIHDPKTKTLLNKRWTNKAWIVCSCEYKGMRRDVMARQSWTELFFLDEATAFAAGHRPCFECRREAAKAFAAAWANAHGLEKALATTMDAVLDAERRRGPEKRLHTLPARLPDGTMVARGPKAYVMHGGLAHAWSPAGYGTGEALEAGARLLTPPSTVATLIAGYAPVLHESLFSR